MQNLTTVTTQAAYGQDQRKPNNFTTYSLASHNFGNQILDGHTFWDTQDYNPPHKVYSTSNSAVRIGVASDLIWTLDKPQVVFPTTGLNNGAIFNDTVDWNMDMYVVGATDEAPATFAPQAYLPWTFNGSSTFPNNKWQPNGGGVSYRTTDGNPAWIAMDGTQPAGEKPFTTDPPQFNSLIQADWRLPIAQQVPPVFLK